MARYCPLIKAGCKQPDCIMWNKEGSFCLIVYSLARQLAEGKHEKAEDYEEDDLSETIEKRFQEATYR